MGIIKKISLLICILLLKGLHIYCQTDSSVVFKWNDRNVKYITVEKGKTLYGISKEHKISQEDIMQLNPELEAGLKAGMKIRIPAEDKVATTVVKETKTTSAHLEHIVKPQETMYGISKTYNIGIPEIERLNPEVKNGLKPGMVLKIFPGSKKPDAPEPVESVNKPEESEKQEKKELKGKCATLNEVEKKQMRKIVFLLPFQKNLEEELQNQVKIGLDFYAGASIALDTLKKMGLNAEVHFIDMKGEASTSSDIIKRKELQDADLIIGPLYSSDFRVVSDFASSKNIPAISPFSQSDAILDDLPYVCKVTADQETLIESSAQFITKRFSRAKVILVKTENPADKEVQSLYSKFLQMSDLDLTEVTYSGIKSISDAFSITKENLVIFPSTAQIQVIDVVSRLNAVRMGNRLSLFGLNEWNSFENIEFEHLNNLNFIWSNTSNANYDLSVFNSVGLKFKEEFKTIPSFYALQAYDVTFYFGNLLLNYGKSFTSCLSQLPFSGIQNDFQWKRNTPTSGFENHAIKVMQLKDFKAQQINEIH